MPRRPRNGQPAGDPAELRAARRNRAVDRCLQHCREHRGHPVADRYRVSDREDRFIHAAVRARSGADRGRAARLLGHRRQHQPAAATDTVKPGLPARVTCYYYYFVRSTESLRDVSEIEIKPLYLSADFATLPLGAVATAAQRAGVARPVERVARAVRSVLHAHRAAWRVSAVPARPVERQPAEVDERDARARQRSGDLSIVPALHHGCAVERRARVADAPRADSRAQRDADSRWHQLPEAGPTLGGSGASVLRHAGQSRQLPSRRDRGALDRRAGMDAGRRVVSARGVADTRGAAARADSRDGALPREMALGPHAAAPDPRGRL